MMRSASISRSCWVSVLWVMPASARYSSLKRFTPLNSCWRMSTFQRPPITASVVSTRQLTCLSGMASTVSFRVLMHLEVHTFLLHYTPNNESTERDSWQHRGPKMITVRRSGDRGTTRLDWLDSRHSFSFGDYYDPRNMGFRVLRVINDDRVAPATGFGMHGHRDMEIVTYVLSGSLEHRDSLGTG